MDALEKASIPKGIATSSARRLAEACLAPFDLARRFRFVLTAEDIVQGKPHPRRSIKPPRGDSGRRRREMLVLEDSQNGCRAAAAAGAFTVAVPGEHSREHDFSVARLVIDGLSDPRIVRGSSVNVKT